MNKELELVDKLFIDTSVDQLLWTKYRESPYVKWVAEKKITENKCLSFILHHHIDDYKYYELRLYLINKSEKTKVLVMRIDQPGLFDFKMKRRMEDLIYLLFRKNKDNFRKTMGPNLPDH